MISQFKHTQRLIIVTILLGLCLTIQPQADTVQADSSIKRNTNDAYRIVAIGDSVTAGYEYGFTEKSIPYGYVEQVYEQALFHGLRAEYSNYAILGLKTTGLKNWLDAAAKDLSIKSSAIQSNLPDPRIEQLLANTKQMLTSLKQADLIVMTIGGNDMYTILSKLESDVPQAEVDLSLKAALDTYETELEASLRMMLQLQPNVQIIIADQYMPIPAPMKVGQLTIPLYPESDRLYLLDCLKQLRSRLDKVNDRLSKEGFHIKTAKVAISFAGNEKAYTSISKGDIHPNRDGYTAMGKAFSKAIWGDYRTVLPKKEEAPVSVVVNGKELLSTYKPLLVNDRTFVPLREITDAMGATLKWNAASQTATVFLQERTVDITVMSPNIRVNGAIVPLKDQAAFIKQVGNTSKLYVPLAALSDGLQFQVVYRGPLKTVFITR